MATVLSCTAVAHFIINLGVGVALAAIGIVGFASPHRYALLIDYADGFSVFNCSGFVFAYGAVLSLISIGFVVTSKLCRNNNLFVTVLTVFSVYNAVSIIVLIATFHWVVEYGHVPALDVLIRSHDKESACWEGIVRSDYDFNSIYGENCYRVNEQLYCAECRIKYIVGEATFIKSNRFVIVFMLITLLCLNIWTLWKLYAGDFVYVNDGSTTVTTTSTATSSSATEEYYAVPKSNKIVENSFLLPPPPPHWTFEENENLRIHAGGNERWTA